MGKKVLKLVDRRPVSGRAVKAMRKVLREIDAGFVTGVHIATVRRDGSCYTFSASECPIRALGAVDLLKEEIRSTEFNITPLKG